MSVELMTLLAGRTVLITVAKVDNKTLRVNVIPALAKADENPALTTPLTYTGPPEEQLMARGAGLLGISTRTNPLARGTLVACAKF